MVKFGKGSKKIDMNLVESIDHYWVLQVETNFREWIQTVYRTG